MKYLLPVLYSLLLIGCSESPPAETPLPAPADTQSITTPAPVSEANSSLTTPASVVKETAVTPTPVAEKPSAPVSKPAEKPAEKPAAKPAIEPKPAVAEKSVTSSVDGAALFGQKCASCHGTKAEKPALGKSQVVAGWDEAQLKEALHGYQAGTYGKEMKALMQGQAKGLNEAQIDALAKHISKL